MNNVDFWSVLYAIGLVITLIVGIINIYLNVKAGKNTLFINTVTSERIKWIQSVREYVAEFCSRSQYWIREYDKHWKDINVDKLYEEYKDINILGMKIIMYLNPSDDEKIINLVERTLRSMETAKFGLYDGSGNASEDLRSIIANDVIPELCKIRESVNELSEETSIMLKEEWERVKNESVHGRSFIKTNKNYNKSFKYTYDAKTENLELMLMFIIFLIIIVLVTTNII